MSFNLTYPAFSLRQNLLREVLHRRVGLQDSKRRPVIHALVQWPVVRAGLALSAGAVIVVELQWVA